MDANSIVQTLGSLFMGTEGEMIQGKNQSLYAEPIDKVFNPYRKEWMQKHLEKYASKHRNGNVGRYNAYVKALKEAEKTMGFIYVITVESAERISADVHIIEHRTEPLPYTGYKQWEPELGLDVSRDKDGKADISLRFEEESFNLSISSREFRRLLKTLSKLPLVCEKSIIRTHYAEFLPEDLRDKYASVAITEGLGRSSHGDGGFYYGHEVELKTRTHYKFRYAFVSEYLWDHPRSYDIIHNTVRKAYAAMEKLSDMLPGLTFVSDHADDCGTSLTWALSSKKERFMDKLTAWNEGKRVTIKTAKDVMEYWGVDMTKFSAERVLEQYRREKKLLDAKTLEVVSALEPEKNGWYLERKWKELRVYTSGERDWNREVYVVVPYDCPKEVYMKILDAKEALAEFCSLMKECRDYFTSVGMFPKSV